MRVCIVAEHASYKFGGEAVLPLHYFSRLRARGIDAWLVVHARTRKELLAAFPEDRQRLLFIEDAWFHKLLFHLSPLLPRRVSESSIGLLSQLITQSLARRIVRKLVARESITVVHQPIPVSPRFPSLMYGVGAPVVIGPMNGGMEYPPAFRRVESLATRAIVRLGRAFSSLVNSLLPGKRQARILLVANRRTQNALAGRMKGEIILFPENGVDLNIWTAESTDRRQAYSSQPDHPRFLFMGRLVSWKCVDIALEALSRLPNAQLEIIGDGPMRSAWSQKAASLGIAARVSFSGWLAQQECALRLQSARALLLPSIYESGGAVVLEAMAAGVPVIATRWGGPVDYLDAESGILIEPHNRESLVDGFADAMCKLSMDANFASRMGKHARLRVQQTFDWEKKIDTMLEFYRQAAADRRELQLRTPAFDR